MRKLLWMLIIPISLLGCKKSDGISTEKQVVFKFKINGVQYDFSGPDCVTACARKSGTSNNPTAYEISSYTSDEFQGLLLWFTTTATLSTQTYNSVYDNVLRAGNYHSEGDVKSFDIKFTKVGNNTCSGTFNGTLGAYNSTSLINVTDGIFQNIEFIK